MAAHWGVEDLPAVTGNAHMKEVAFAKAFQSLRNRTAIFADLPPELLSKPQLKEKLMEIGRIAVTTPDPEEKGVGR